MASYPLKFLDNFLVLDENGESGVSRVDAEIPALMPCGEAPVRDRDVMTIGDLIHYQYAKIIAKGAFGAPGWQGG